MTEETCWTVVHGAVDGDPSARSRFAETYMGIVRAYLGARWRTHVARERIEDAVQDVFLDCFRSGGALGRLDGSRRVAFRTFLYGVVRNVALRYEEKGQRRREQQLPSTFDPEGVAGDDDGLSRAFDRAWAQGLIRGAAIRQKAAAARRGEAARRRVDLLRLRFSEGLPIREIAKRWEVDAPWLHHEYAKAREEFKKALREEVAFHDPDSPQAVERKVVDLLELLQRG